ncbi:hypothetical protein GM31_00115 [Trabulsiella odontotermitis]|uniref:Uncharacterized protein n=2 Tax=Trabulsiella odontotermitis TaxID=379893 RepID=A0A0L0GU18_9ENTR|nr:hypothetical protein GM31_00115 [Trabulsiella odontotermitis]
MTAPGNSLTLNVFDGGMSDNTTVQWPVPQNEGEYKKLNMLFNQGTFTLRTKGDISLGVGSPDSKFSDEEHIYLDVSESNVSLISDESRIIIGGTEGSIIKSHYTGSLLLQAAQIDFISGTIHCEGNADVKCAALSIVAAQTSDDLLHCNPVFNLIADEIDNPSIEFWNPLDKSKSPWHFTENKNEKEIFNFITFDRQQNKNGCFIFNGITNGNNRDNLMTNGYLAIDGNPVIGSDNANKLFNVTPTGSGIKISLK